MATGSFLVRAEGWRTSMCLGCGASIIWVTTAGGKQMPMDCLDFDAKDAAQPWMLRVESKDTHWATCSKWELFARRGLWGGRYDDGS